MLVVAIVAVVVAGITMKRRRDDHMASASFYAAKAKVARRIAKNYVKLAALNRMIARLEKESADHVYIPPSERHLPLPRGGFEIQQERREKAERAESDAEEDERNAEASGPEAAKYQRLQEKHEKAARHPWLAVEPDPQGFQ